MLENQLIFNFVKLELVPNRGEKKFKPRPQIGSWYLLGVSDEHPRLFYMLIPLPGCAAHDGKVGCNTAENTTAFVYSDWLYFLWRGTIFSCSG